MSYLLIDRKNCALKITGKRLVVVSHGERQQQSYPLNMLETIVFTAQNELDTQLLLKLDKSGINVVIMSTTHQDHCLVNSGFRHGNSRRRIKQYHALCNDEQRLNWARDLVLRKILIQYRFVLLLRKRNPKHRYAHTCQLRHIKKSWLAAKASHTIAGLRGCEGAAAAAYFEAYTLAVPTEWGFQKRLRRPPKDPVNALLSLSYTLVFSESVTALSAVGLDPSIGMLHELSYKRESLACDLIELFRVRTDHWVLDFVKQQEIKPSHFSIAANGACLLNKSGRAIFYRAYYTQARQWRGEILSQAKEWAILLDNFNETE